MMEPTITYVDVPGDDVDDGDDDDDGGGSGGDSGDGDGDGGDDGSKIFVHIYSLLLLMSSNKISLLTGGS